MSIIFLVLRVFCPQNRDPFYWVLQSLNILNTIFYIIFFFIPIFLCQPRLKIWEQKTPGKCLQIYYLYIASSVFNILSDIAMYSAPFWKIWHLHMPKGRKLGMSAVFATGGLSASPPSSPFRIYTVLMFANSAIIFALFRLIFLILLLIQIDFSYTKLQGTIFALSELATGIICSCLFVLPRLYRHLTTSPPHDSEEHRLRKYKMLTGKSSLTDPYSQKVHHDEEQRNPWEGHDIEEPAVPQVSSTRH